MSGWFGYRLFAIDLDGTLLRDDQSIAEVDRAAVAELTRAGAEVVIATGRFPGSARAIARDLCCQRALICADGAVVLASNAARLLSGLEPSHVTRLSEHARARRLHFFALGSESVHFASHDEAYLAYLEGWTGSARRYRDSQIHCGVVCVFALGQQHEVKSAHRELAELGVCLDAVPLTESIWALRARARGIDKGSALEELCRHRGYGRSEIVALGNDWNDLALFNAAGRSFAMRDSPVGVQAHATCVLDATSEHGGALAEVLARISQAD